MKGIKTMNDVQRAELERYFRPIYYIEFEEIPEGELFPVKTRVGYYSPFAKKDASEVFNKNPGAKKLIEKSMRTGKEKILLERN